MPVCCTEVTGPAFGLIPCTTQALAAHAATSKFSCYLALEVWGIL